MAAPGKSPSDGLARKLHDEAKKEEVYFRNIIPRTGFIGKYLSYTDRQESPGSYHFWVAATMLSATVQRRAWINKGIYNVYPSIYTILVSPSGRCRKSRAIRLGTELIEDFSWINIIADKTSPEAFLQALMEGTQSMAQGPTAGPAGGINIPVGTPDATGLIRATELGVFINRQTYTSGMVGILTDLFDCPNKFQYLTRNKKPIILHNVAITFLGATTPKWLATNLPEGAFEGGFMSRFILVVKEVRDRRISFSAEPPQQEKRDLRDCLLRIHINYRGSIPLENPARNWFDDWYTSGTADIIDNEEMSGFVERKPDTVLKLALLLSASDQRDTIRVEDLQSAKRIIDWTQEKMFDGFAHVDLSHIGSLRHKTLEALKLAGGRLSRRDVMRKFGGRINGVKDLEEIEAIMKEAGDIEIKFWRKNDTGRWGKGYVLTDSVQNYTDMVDVHPENPNRPAGKKKS